MNIKVRFFASLREELGLDAKELDSAAISTVADVWSAATGQQVVPDHVVCAVNLEHRDTHEPVSEGDEVAFFPPVTGG